MSFCALDDNPPPLEFPCDYPIKIMGEASENFHTEMLALIRCHAPEVCDADVSLRASSGGKYVSVSIQLRAESREQVDAIVIALREHPKVLASL
jgi:putative lipoic acid-binding regulatory protein